MPFISLLFCHENDYHLQIKELYEEGGEKISSKTAKEMLERAVAVEESLHMVDAIVSSVFVSPQVITTKTQLFNIRDGIYKNIQIFVYFFLS